MHLGIALTCTLEWTFLLLDVLAGDRQGFAAVRCGGVRGRPQVSVRRRNNVSAPRLVVLIPCEGNYRRVAVMQLRYNYRAYPDAAQCRELARAFGCARVVWNDCLRDRKEAHAAGLP